MSGVRCVDCPKGWPVDAVRETREEIARRVKELAAGLQVGRRRVGLTPSDSA